jgi:hypothetical protein
MHTTHNNQAGIYGFVSFANCHLMPTRLASGTFWACSSESED